MPHEKSASVRLAVETSKLEDRFVASVPGLGLFAYAGDESEAVDRLGESADLLFDAIEKQMGQEALFDMLLKIRGVKVDLHIGQPIRRPAIDRLTLTPCVAV